MENPVNLSSHEQTAKQRWNAAADHFNQWDDLGGDEKRDLIRAVADESLADLSLQFSATVFHGTNKRFESFSAEFSGTAGLSGAEYGEAYFFTDSADVASEYAQTVAQNKGGLASLLKAEIVMAHPMSFDFSCDDRTVVNVDQDSLGDDALIQEELISLARERGHDGLITWNFNDGGKSPVTQYIVFNNTQISMVEWTDASSGH